MPLHAYSSDQFITKLEDLVERQGEETFLALALHEVGHQYVQDVMPEQYTWIIQRTIALWEEEQ